MNIDVINEKRYHEKMPMFFLADEKSQSIRTRHFLTEKEQDSMTEIDFSAIKKPTITSRGVVW